MCVLDAYTHTMKSKSWELKEMHVSLRLDFSTAVKLNEPISGVAFNS